jgi:hypothetical protein
MGNQEGSQIGTLNENPLHAGLKEWYAEPDDRVEVGIDGYVVDIVRGDLLIEIQTGSLYPIRDKLRTLVKDHPVRLICPLAQDKYIVKLPKQEGGEVSRRKSPKHCRVVDLFDELVTMPDLLQNSNFGIEALLTKEEEVRRHEAGRAWRRRGWVIQERRLIEVVDRQLFEKPAEMVRLIPTDVAQPFTTADLAEAVDIRRRLAQKMAYCLRNMGAITQVGKDGNAYLYERTAEAAA